MTAEPASPYNTLCPVCGAPSIARTRGIPTSDRCANGHSYLANTGLESPPSVTGSFDHDEIAKIIDPQAFDGSIRNRVGRFDEAVLRQQTALLKANEIVALIQPHLA